MENEKDDDLIKLFSQAMNLEGNEDSNKNENIIESTESTQSANSTQNTNENPLLKLKNVSFYAQSNDIVDNISLSINKNETVALAGMSGCGKSTILKLAAGLIVPTEGSVLFDNLAIDNMNRKQNLDFRKKSAFVFQDSALWANQTLRQSLELPLKIHYPQMSAQDRTKRIQEVLVDVGYERELDIRPSQLSMGEQKLIAFARAQLCHPELLFLDEWTESLDETAARRLIDLVVKYQKKGCTIVFVTHDIRIIKEIAQRIIIISDGSVSLDIDGTDSVDEKSIAKLIQKGVF